MARRKTTTKTKKPAAAAAAPNPDQEFLDAIYAEPASDDARLVYADVLLERGDPRGEMIQIQCEVARINEDDERWHRIRHRERTLLRENEPQWSKELLELDKFIFFRFHRGFVEEVGGMASTLAKHAEKLVKHAPLLCRFGVNAHAPEDLPKLIASVLYPKIVELRLGSARSRLHLDPFEKADHPSNIRVLQFSEVALGEEDFITIANAPVFANLRELGFEVARFNKDALAPLSRIKAPLERFQLMTSHSAELLVQGIVQGPAFTNLKALIITNNQIQDKGLAAIISANRLHRVEELDLRSNELSADAVASLLDPKNGNAIGPIKKLWLASNPGVDDDFVAKLLKWQGAERLEKLDLGGGSKITSDGIMMIAKSPVLTNLRSLVISDVKVNEATKNALLASPALARSRLYIDDKFLARNKD